MLDFHTQAGMKKGGKAKKQGYKDREDESIAAQDVEKNQLRNNLSKIDAMSPMENGANAKKSGKINK